MHLPVSLRGRECSSAATLRNLSDFSPAMLLGGCFQGVVVEEESIYTCRSNSETAQPPWLCQASVSDIITHQLCTEGAELQPHPSTLALFEKTALWPSASRTPVPLAEESIDPRLHAHPHTIPPLQTC